MFGSGYPGKEKREEGEEEKLIRGEKAEEKSYGRELIREVFIERVRTLYLFVHECFLEMRKKNIAEFFPTS